MICQHENHLKKPIMGGCTYQGCQMKRDCCFKCLQELHKGHVEDLIDLPDLNSWAKSISEECQMWQDLQIIASDIFQYFKSIIEEIKQESKIEDRGHTKFNIMINCCLLMKSANSQLKAQIEQIQALLNKLNDDCLLFQQQNDFNSILSAHNNSIIRQFNSEDSQQQNNSFDQKKQGTKFKSFLYMPIIFSQEMKHQQIIINDKTISISNENSRFILCENQIKNNMIGFFTFRPIQCSMIYIGIAQKQVMEQNKYQFTDYFKSGQSGYYLISNQGEIFTRQQQNNQIKQNFSFDKGHIVIIQVDLISKKMIWLNRNCGIQVEVKVEIEMNDEYYPCIGLSQGSSIEIVSNIQ